MEQLTRFFQQKYGPTQAMEMLKYELQLKHGEDYFHKAAERICPDVPFAERWLLFA